MGQLIYEGPMMAWIQICIGAAILMLAAAPLAYIIARWW